ncbi:MAG: hypothetical protein MUO26_10310 [Methanotrichaceae archaeon]|nr:hypothetical protein [Methanotrichaceae archaeon]
MKHTSIMLPEHMFERIRDTGKSPSLVIREALERYFDTEVSALELIREHERLYHMPDISHKIGINIPEIVHRNVQED